MACHRVTLGSSVVIWLMIPCGLPQGSSLERIKVLNENDICVQNIANNAIYAIERIKVRESETISIRLKKLTGNRPFKEDVDIGQIDELDLYEFYKKGIKEEAIVEIEAARDNSKSHKDMLASDLSSWPIFIPHLDKDSEIYSKSEVKLINGVTLKNPLYLYNLIYKNCLDFSHARKFNTLWSKTIHGDLNVGNILVELNGSTTEIKLIDYASLKEGPIDFDFGELETDIKVRFLAETLTALGEHRKEPSQEIYVNIIYKFEEAICNGTKNISFINDVFGPISNEDFKRKFKRKFENGFSMIQEIRNARKKIYEDNNCSDEKDPHLVALFFESLSILGLGEIGKWGKIWAFIAAAMAYEKLVEQIPELEEGKEGKRAGDIPPVQPELKKEAVVQKEQALGLTTPKTKEDVGEFDVFMAYHTGDKKEVIALSKLLEGRGLKPWLDIEQVPPGRWFQDIIQKAIPKVKSAAIIIGKEDIGKWQILELRSFISQCVDKGMPVIPVLLPDIFEFPSELLFLKELSWVRFIYKIDEQKALDNLEWGIKGEHPQRKQK